jgi:hypothetical protein
MKYAPMTARSNVREIEELVRRRMLGHSWVLKAYALRFLWTIFWVLMNV